MISAGMRVGGVVNAHQNFKFNKTFLADAQG
jgi:hypothetical protein